MINALYAPVNFIQLRNYVAAFNAKSFTKLIGPIRDGLAMKKDLFQNASPMLLSIRRYLGFGEEK